MTDMPLKEALPVRYRVGRVGTPDPESSQYYVLDVVNDYQARAQLRGLVRVYRTYGSTSAADELEKLLDDTAEDHKKAVTARAERARATQASFRKR